MIDLLISLESLINIVFYRADIPNDCGLLSQNFFANYSRCGSHYCYRFLFILNFFCGWQFSKSIVLESVSNDLDITISQIKIVSSIWWRVWPQLDGIFVDSEDQISLPELSSDFDYGSIFKKHWGELLFASRKLLRLNVVWIILRILRVLRLVRGHQVHVILFGLFQIDELLFLHL